MYKLSQTVSQPYRISAVFLPHNPWNESQTPPTIMVY